MSPIVRTDGTLVPDDDGLLGAGAQVLPRCENATRERWQTH
jgi:hypothetical protein